MAYEIQQSQTAQPLTFLMVSSTDHVTAVTGLSPTVTLSKNGAAFGSPAGAVTEIGNGWYKVAGNATDAGTLGPLLLHATGTGADPVDDRYSVVSYNPLDAVRLGLTALPNVASGSAGALPTTGTGANQISVASGLVDITQTAADKVWSSATRTLSAFSTALAVSVWDVLASAVATASSIGLQLKTNIDAAVTSRLAPTTAGRTLDVATTGEAGLDFDNVKDATGAHTLTNITVPTVTTAVNLTTNNDKTGYSVGTGGIVAGSFATDSITSGALSNGAADEISDHVWASATRTLTSFGTLAADVWAVGTRTLTSFGTLAADAATAVWAAGTRTLTTFGTLVADVTAAVWGAGTRTLTSFGTLIADIWTYATRTLTTAIAAVTPPPVITGDTVTITRGDTITLPFVNLGNITGRSKLWLTVKGSTEDADADAVFQIEETAGLVVLNGATATAGNGTTTIINQATGAVTFTLKPAASATLELNDGLAYDVQVLIGGVVTTLTQGDFVVSRDITRSYS